MLTRDPNHLDPFLNSLSCLPPGNPQADTREITQAKSCEASWETPKTIMNRPPSSSRTHPRPAKSVPFCN
jgi:hypothetical protein